VTIRTTTPAAPADLEAWLPLDQLKAQLSIEGVGDWDALLVGYRLAALEDLLQPATQRRFLTQVVEWSLPGWPRDFTLPLAPVAVDGVQSIKYVDSAGVQQTWPADQYVVSPCGPTVSIRPKFGVLRPLLGFDAAEPVIVRFSVGTAPAGVAEGVRLATAQLVALMFDNRGDAPAPDLAPSKLPTFVETLIGSERW
jgi:uncharacterized phiE125 gp8 family phage protein